MTPSPSPAEALDDPTGVAVRRGPGRPRLEDLDERILQATLETIDADEAVTVSRVVARSGVSRAALYRRWPSLTTLIAAALDVGRTVPGPVPVHAAGALRETVFEFLMGPQVMTVGGYPDHRFRQRIALVMADRELQQAYWESYVARRRVPVEDALRAGIDSGELRSDLDVDACSDLISGVFYYQLIVRGESFDDPRTLARCKAAFDTAWRGMQA